MSDAAHIDAIPQEGKERRSLDVLRLLFVGFVVGIAVTSAALLAVNPIGLVETTPEIQGKALDLLRDCVLLGLGALVSSPRGNKPSEYR
jgi:hypothetical protein